jgi:segregation and condensation protein A
MPRVDRDVFVASADAERKRTGRSLPEVTLQEMILAFREVVQRAEMFAHHHVQRERLSVRARMADIVTRLDSGDFVEFGRLFRAEEGRMGVTVTFMAILELVREGLLELVQTEAYGPLHVRAASPGRGAASASNEGES